MPKRVAKALTPEERELIGTMKATIAQLESIDTAGSAEDPALQAIEGLAQAQPNQVATPTPSPAPAPATDTQDDNPTEPAPPRPKKAVPFIGKGVGTTPDEGIVANDDAEDKVEETTDVDADNIREVQRALERIAKRRGVTVGKAAGDETTQAILVALQGIVGELAVQKDAMGGLLEALGVADQIIAAGAPPVAQPVQKDRRPVGATDTQAVAKAIVDALREVANSQPKEPELPGDRLGEVRKDLSAVLGPFFRSSGLYG